MDDYIVNLVDGNEEVRKPLHGWSYEEWLDGLDDYDDDVWDYCTPRRLVTSSRNSTADSSHPSTASATSGFSWHTSPLQDRQGDDSIPDAPDSGDDSDDLIDLHSDVIDNMMAAQIELINHSVTYAAGHNSSHPSDDCLLYTSDAADE